MIGYKVTYIFNGKLDIVYFASKQLANDWVKSFNGSLEEIFINTSKGD